MTADFLRVRYDLAHDGVAHVEQRIAEEVLAPLRNELTPLFAGLSVTERRGGLRQVFARSTGTRALAANPTVLSAVEAALGSWAFPVRALFFDKTPGANWRVIWHQDLTVTVREQREVPGFGPWTMKGGAAHAHAPIELLEHMVAVRIHLDDCGADNGPLRVLPGSHRERRLSRAQISAWLARVPERVCLVPAGGILLMRPLLLHASSSARSPGHRRVIHLEYACNDLPAGLVWGEQL